MIDLLKWMLPLLASVAVFAITLTWRTAHKAGKIDHELGLLAQIKDRTDKIPQVETAMTLLAAEIKTLLEQQKKMASNFPKAVNSLDRRVSKLEWVNEIEGTGKYTLPPMNGEGED